MRIPLENFTSVGPEGTLRWNNFWDVYLPFQILIWLFYLAILIVLFVSKKLHFRSGFFLLFKYTAISDICVSAATVIYSLNFRLGFNPRWNYFIALCSTMSGGSYMIHLFGGLSMTFCQLTAVALPVKHSQIWKPSFVKKYFFILSVICYLPFVSVLLLGVEFEYETETNSWYYTKRRGYFPYMNLISSIAITIYEVVGLAVGVTVIIILRRSKKWEQTRRNIQETKLVLFSIINVAVGTIDFIFETESLNYFMNNNSGFAIWFQNQFTFYFFLLMTTNSIAILVISSATRKELMSMLKCLQVRLTGTSTTVKALDVRNRTNSKT